MDANIRGLSKAWTDKIVLAVGWPALGLILGSRAKRPGHRSRWMGLPGVETAWQGSHSHGGRRG
jgi:hypothetical protein